MHSDHSSVIELAEAIADGAQIDWDHAESSVDDPAELHIVRQLRQLAAVGVAARKQALTFGGLEARGEIGRGMFGTVHRAWDTRLEREVALKLLHPSSSKQDATGSVLKEAKLLARIRHPNVVTVYGADIFDSRVGIWMEFVTGKTLKDIVSEQGPFSAHEAAVIGRDVCGALAAVHQQGFLHRDIKAQNVMREAGGRTVLMDFGAALQPAADVTPALGGTPLYLAPEILAGAPPSVLSDLYSVATMLFYLVSLEFPVVGESLDDLRRNHAAGKRRLLRDVRPDLPGAFVRLVDGALSPNPIDRPQSAGAMEALLEEALVESSRVRPSKGWRALTDWRLIAASAVIVAALAAVGWAWRERPARAASAATRNSVAILPFRNLTSQNGNDYFSDGITDDLVALLASLRDLRVVSGASVQRFRDRSTPENEIGSALGVAAVFDGSVRRSGEHVRIVGKLIDVGTGTTLWSDSFERDGKDIFTMQSEVAGKIAVALKGKLSERDMERLTARSRDFQAFDLYAEGRDLWRQRTEGGINRAITLFHEALERDPKYAAAYAGLADAYTSQGIYASVPRIDAYARAFEAAEKAVALDPTLAEAQASWAYAQKNRFEWTGAEASFRRALELRPGYAEAHHWYSIFLTQHGRFPEAISEIKAAISIDPLSNSANLQLGSLFLMARRYDAAASQLQNGIHRDPGSAIAYRTLAETYTQQGDFSEALASYERAGIALGVSAEDYELKADLAYLHARAGRRAEALKILNELKQRYEIAGEEVAVSIAAIYTGLGDVEPALDWLTRARDRRESAIGYVKVHPRWDPLRSNARFTAILQSLGFSQTST